MCLLNCQQEPARDGIVNRIRPTARYGIFFLPFLFQPHTLTHRHTQTATTERTAQQVWRPSLLDKLSTSSYSFFPIVFIQCVYSLSRSFVFLFSASFTLCFVVVGASVVWPSSIEEPPPCRTIFYEDEGAIRSSPHDWICFA